MNLIADPWIPIVRQSGARERIRPCDLTSQLATDPVISINWPRADLCAATHEFLIGLLSTACPPAGDSAWSLWHKVPPSPTELLAHFAPLAAAFKLTGFMQELGGLPDGKLIGPGSLFMEQPGENTLELNSDLFIKRGQIEVLGQSTAAIALFTLETYASGGGAGYRTSVRGGGPLTTLAFSHGMSLWSFLWLNVVATFDPLEHGSPEQRLADVFPWLAPTRTSDDGRITTLADVHPAQSFWGVPRRVVLRFEPNIDHLPCSITGEIEPVIVREIVCQSHGVNYVGVPHPLSPCYFKKDKSGEFWLPVHNNPGALAYGNWPGFVASGKTARAATCVAAAKNRLRAIGGEAFLRLHGFDMDNAKARNFAEAERPLLIAAPEHEAAFASLVGAMVNGAALVAEQTFYAINDVRDAKRENIRGAFFAATETDFFETVRKGLAEIEAAPGGSRVEFCRSWLKDILAPSARNLFDREIAPEALAADGDVGRLQKACNARRNLKNALLGYGKSGAKIYATLGIPAPESKKGTKK